jgi:hypothetical protein
MDPTSKKISLLIMRRYGWHRARMDSGMAADNDLDLDLLRWIADESVADDHWVLVDLLSQEEIEDLKAAIKRLSV